MAAVHRAGGVVTSETTFSVPDRRVCIATFIEVRVPAGEPSRLTLSVMPDRAPE